MTIRGIRLRKDVRMNQNDFKPHIDSIINHTPEFFYKEQERIILYYIYPKIKDFQKMFLIIIGMWWGYSVQNTKFEWGNGIAAFVCIELLLYAARYQWNDILGFNEYIHSSKDENGKNIIRLRSDTKYRGFPLISKSVKTNLEIAVFMAALRTLLAIIVAYEFFGKNRLNIPFLVCFVLIILSTLGYEKVRSCDENKAHMVVVMVGFGYPLRLLSGFFAVNTNVNYDLREMLAIVLVAIGIYYYGIMSALIPWMYEVLQERKNTKKRYFIYFLKKIRYEDSVKQYISKQSNNIEMPCANLGEEQRSAICGMERYIPWTHAFELSIVCLVGAIIVSLTEGELKLPAEIVIAFIVLFGTVLLYKELKLQEQDYTEEIGFVKKINNEWIKELFFLLVILALCLLCSARYVNGICFMIVFVVLTYIFLIDIYNPYVTITDVIIERKNKLLCILAKFR